MRASKSLNPDQELESAPTVSSCGHMPRLGILHQQWSSSRSVCSCILVYLQCMYESHVCVCVCVCLTLRMAGRKLWASLRRELRSCWKPCSSAGEAAEVELCWGDAGEQICCSRHRLVRVTSSRSHSNNCTNYRHRDREKEKESSVKHSC